MNVLVLEDERLIGRQLLQDLQTLEPGATIHGPLASNREALEWLSCGYRADLILADIQLSDGVSFESLQAFPADCPVIFTTAFDDYALRAFRLYSIDYLLKPIDRAELRRALDKFHLIRSKFGQGDFTAQMSDLFSGRSGVQSYKTRFAVHAGRQMRLVPTGDIAGFYKQDLIFLADRHGDYFVTDHRSLDEIEELVDPQQFFRVGRRQIVHLPYIESFRPIDHGRLEVRLKAPFPESVEVSREKAASFRRWAGC